RTLPPGGSDADFNGWGSHKIRPLALRGPPRAPSGEAAVELQRLSANAREMLRLGRGLEEALFVVGQATHFVQDLNQPLHAAWGETRAQHDESESPMRDGSRQEGHADRGLVLVKSYSCFAYEIAHDSSRHARALFFDRQITRVTEIAWDRAVNDTANLWQSIVWHALGRERAWQLYGIPEPVGEIGTGSGC